MQKNVIGTNRIDKYFISHKKCLHIMITIWDSILGYGPLEILLNLGEVFIGLELEKISED